MPAYVCRKKVLPGSMGGEEEGGEGYVQALSMPFSTSMSDLAQSLTSWATGITNALVYAP